MSNYPRIGGASPWGTIQTVQTLTELDQRLRAPVIDQHLAWVTTASHGGFWLSPYANSRMLDAFRREDGWYEEDVDASAVFLSLAHPADGANDAQYCMDIRIMSAMHLADYRHREVAGLLGIALPETTPTTLPELEAVFPSLWVARGLFDRSVTIGPLRLNLAQQTLTEADRIAAAFQEMVLTRILLMTRTELVQRLS